MTASASWLAQMGRRSRPQLVRFVDGSPEPATTRAPAEQLDPPLVGRAPGRLQRAVPGSHADLPLPPGWDADGHALLRMWFLSTTPGGAAEPDAAGASASRMTGKTTLSENRRQVICALGRKDDPAALAVAIGPDGLLSIELTGHASCGRARHASRAGPGTACCSTWTAKPCPPPHDAPGQLVHGRPRGASPSPPGRAGGCVTRQSLRLATCAHGRRRTRPSMARSPLRHLRRAPGRRCVCAASRARTSPRPLVAAWDPSLEPGSDRVVDTGPAHLDGHTFNLPTRAATGPFWVPGVGYHAPDAPARCHPLPCR